MMKSSRVIWLCVGLCVIGALLLNMCYVYGTQDAVYVVVNKTERITTGTSESLSHKYLVYSASETFENTDTIWHWKWNSSDLHGKLEPDHEYIFSVYGWRIPILSVYRNIVEVREVAQDPPGAK